jgi:tRNA-specific 2-thiouridylase
VHDERLIVHLEVPIRGLARGQAVVLYDGTRVLGSATVDATSRDFASSAASRSE